MTSAPAAATETARAMAVARRTIRARARRGQALAMVLGLVMVGAVVYLSHPAAIVPKLQRLGLGTVLEVLALNLPVLGLRSWRADLILRRLGQRVPIHRMLAVQLVGQTSSALTPAASGDFVRAWLWRRDDEVPLATGAATVVFERSFSFGLLIAVAVLLVAFPRFGLPGWALVATGLTAAALAPYLFSRSSSRSDRWLERVISRLPWIGGSSERVLRALGELRAIMASPPVLLSAGAATIVIYALSGFQLWILADALGHHSAITQMVATYAISQIGGIVSTLPFGLGPADIVAVGAMARYGVDVSMAAVVVLLSRVLATLPMAIASIPAYLLLGRPSITGSGE
ncbi:MAG TPA: lysylphosphatidylglycerol synthase transmembrane domain-containing protein [Candidatus Dormibacteraeota bacterium]|nr:lysylphosphatidylglycerol synthase transmembrane domain-containing protein [Candidatus Dormibacteraeota bacterium]